MNKKAIVVALFAIIFVLAATGIAPRPVSAQFPMSFGSTRYPALAVDSNDVLYMAMSVATGTSRPHSQIFFTQSNDSGANWDNLPQTRNLTKSPGEAFGPSLGVTRQGGLRLY